MTQYTSDLMESPKGTKCNGEHQHSWMEVESRKSVTVNITDNLSTWMACNSLNEASDKTGDKSRIHAIYTMYFNCLIDGYQSWNFNYSCCIPCLRYSLHAYNPYPQ